MNSPASRDHVRDAFRGYRITVIYICVAVTLILALLLFDLVNGPIPTPCP